MAYRLEAKAPTKMVERKTPLLRIRVLQAMSVYCGHTRGQCTGAYL